MVSKNLLITLTEEKTKKVILYYGKFCFRGTAFWVSFESVKGSPFWGVARFPIAAWPITQGNYYQLYKIIEIMSNFNSSFV